MKRFWWRIRVTFWLWRLSSMTTDEAWGYSAGFLDAYAEYEEFDPREAVETDMSYWEV